MAVKPEVQQTENGQFVFQLIDSNGQVLFTSRPYAQQADARNGLISVKERAGKIGNFERKKSSTNQMYFDISDVNRRIIGSSESHSSIADLEKNITAVNAWGRAAAADDGTDSSKGGSV